MHRQFSRLLHSGLIVAALLPISPLAAEFTAAFSPAFTSRSRMDAPNRLEVQSQSGPVQTGRGIDAVQPDGNLLKGQPVQVAAEGPAQMAPEFRAVFRPEASGLGLPQNRSGGGTR